jgi:hypothetical protein
MNTIKSSLLFLLIVMCLYSCSRKGDCPQLETQYFYTRFSVEDTSFIPYHGKDTLWFQDNNGNTMKLVCYEKFPYSKKTCVDLSENPDCGNFWNCQVEDQFYIKFRTDDKKNELNFSLTTNYLSSIGTIMYECELNSIRIFGKSNFDVIKINPLDSIKLDGKVIVGSLFTIDSVGLYNKDYGLLRFKDKNSIVWTLTDKR